MKIKNSAERVTPICLSLHVNILGEKNLYLIIKFTDVVADDDVHLFLLWVHLLRAESVYILLTHSGRLVIR